MIITAHLLPSNSLLRVSAHFSCTMLWLLRQPACEAGRNCVYSPYYILLPEKPHKIMYLKSYTFACKEHLKGLLGGKGVFLFFFLFFLSKTYFSVCGIRKYRFHNSYDEVWHKVNRNYSRQVMSMSKSTQKTQKVHSQSTCYAQSDATTCIFVLYVKFLRCSLDDANLTPM